MGNSDSHCRVQKDIMQMVENSIEKILVYNGMVYERILKPANGEKVLLFSDGVMIPVVIESGEYWGIYGVSNFWYWTEIETKKKGCGYGAFCRSLPNT